MDLDSIKKAIESGNIALLHEFINNEAILQKFVNGDPRTFYEILSSAINVNRNSLSQMMSEDVNEVYDGLILQLIKAAKEVHFGLFDGDTLLTTALNNCMSCDIIIELVKAGSDVNIRSSCRSIFSNAATDYETPLLRALDSGNDIKVIAELLNLGADVNCRDHNGWTPLFSGMFNHCERPDLILLLLNAGSNVHNIDNDGRNILMLNSCDCLDVGDCKSKESIDELLSHGINDLDFKHTDNYGNTVLHKTDCEYVFELAMKSGVSIEAKNNLGWTPLLSNLLERNEGRLFYLLKSGANVLCTDEGLCTVLHEYITSDCDDFPRPCILDMLIYHGGKMFGRNINNLTPLDLIIRTHRFSRYVNIFFTIIDFIAMESIYVIPKHVILFDDNGFDFTRKALENVDTGVSVDTFINACEKELDVMRKTFIKDGLTFYEFCILKRYHKSKCINIAPDEYKYSFDDISKLFPLYKNIIIIRIKDNRRKKHELDFRRVFERIVLSPVNTTETDNNELLNYHCLYHISQFLNLKDMFNVFTAAIEI